MKNKTMDQLVFEEKAADLSKCEKNGNDDYMLDDYDPSKNYCDVSTGEWILSVGKSKITGLILASTTFKFVVEENFECLYKRQII